MKKRIIILEILPKERGSIKTPLSEEFINKIKIVPLYGGHYNPNLAFEIGIEFPEEIELISKKVKVIEYDEISGDFKTITKLE